MNLTPETIDKLLAISQQHARIYSDDEREIWLINGNTQEITKPEPTRSHSFASLEGFIEYLNGPRSGTADGIVFIGDHAVTAQLNYMSVFPETATLPLKLSEEYRALCNLMTGIGQKPLWRELLTALYGCLPLELFMQVSNIKVSGKMDADLQIERIGTTKEAASTSLRVTYTPNGKPSESADVGTEWVFKGRIWECFDQTFEIPLTIEIDAKDGLKFTFHPRRLQSVLKTATLALAASIREQVPAPRFSVHEGTF